MTGAGVAEFVGKVAVVEQAGRSVRVLLHEGETLYSARDILMACGCKYPEKWCKREQDAQSSVKLRKLPYPVNGKTGGNIKAPLPDVLHKRDVRPYDVGYDRMRQRRKRLA